MFDKKEWNRKNYIKNKERENKRTIEWRLSNPEMLQRALIYLKKHKVME